MCSKQQSDNFWFIRLLIAVLIGIATPLMQGCDDHQGQLAVSAPTLPPIVVKVIRKGSYLENGTDRQGTWTYTNSEVTYYTVVLEEEKTGNPRVFEHLRANDYPHLVVAHEGDKAEVTIVNNKLSSFKLILGSAPDSTDSASTK